MKLKKLQMIKLKNTKIFLSGVGNLSRFVDRQNGSFYFALRSGSKKKKILPIIICFIVVLVSITPQFFPDLNLLKEKFIILISLPLVFVLAFSYICHLIKLENTSINYQLDSKISLSYKKKVLKRGMSNFWTFLAINVLFLVLLALGTVNFYQSGRIFPLTMSFMSVIILALTLAFQKTTLPLSNYLAMKKIYKGL